MRPTQSWKTPLGFARKLADQICLQRPAKYLTLAVLVGTLGVGLPDGASARDTVPSGGLRLGTNQAYVAEILRRSNVDIANVRVMFDRVLNALPDRVTVYPTENYYYFNFHHNGVKFLGNIRLANDTRDTGVVHFVYYKDMPEWISDDTSFSATLGAKQGVKVEKVHDLAYRITSGAKSVLFELNDLRGVAPPDDALRPGEEFLGPIFDESGVRFFLIFDPASKRFLYVLDESVPVADEFPPNRYSKAILLGRRTGFVYYIDAPHKRKILIGVYSGNVVRNNYFDGPFDQLPDNFIKGDSLRNAILMVQPDLKGKMDRFGNSPDGQARFMIAPYLQYQGPDDLIAMAKCAAMPVYGKVLTCMETIEVGTAPGEEPAEEPEDPTEEPKE